MAWEYEMVLRSLSNSNVLYVILNLQGVNLQSELMTKTQLENTNLEPALEVVGQL